MQEPFSCARTISIHAPLTGSDGCCCSGCSFCCYFNPRSPHRERPRCRMPPSADIISIHAPLTGSDEDGYFQDFFQRLFQSTLPSQGATVAMGTRLAASGISIHAPLTGSDGTGGNVWTDCFYFNPRSPHRERRSAAATDYRKFMISIHAPLTGSDCLRWTTTDSL